MLFDDVFHPIKRAEQDLCLAKYRLYVLVSYFVFLVPRSQNISSLLDKKF